MSIICHNVLGIRDDGTIYELVVIWIRFNQPKPKLRIDPNDIVRPENCLYDHTADNG